MYTLDLKGQKESELAANKPLAPATFEKDGSINFAALDHTSNDSFASRQSLDNSQQASDRMARQSLEQSTLASLDSSRESSSYTPIMGDLAVNNQQRAA